MCGICRSMMSPSGSNLAGEAVMLWWSRLLQLKYTEQVLKTL